MIDYQGIATLIASLTTSIVALVTLRRQGEIKKNVQLIEKATNSMKDALVSATREQSLLEGAARGRKDEEERNALKAQGAAAAAPQQYEGR